MLTAEHITKKYGKKEALHDLSFVLQDGTVNVLLGPNGAGKSTMMKSIIGLLKYEGSIELDGISTKENEVRRKLGYIPELPALYPNLTVREHMEFIARVYNLKNYKDRMNSLLDRFEMTSQEKKFGDELSKGMQQKLNLCLGLLPDPDFILLDEPMIGLDPHAIKELKNLILELKAQGKTILISTHIIDSIESLWDRTIILAHGEIKADVTREESGERKLEDVFFAVTEEQA